MCFITLGEENSIETINRCISSPYLVSHHKNIGDEASQFKSFFYFKREGF